MSDRRPLAKLEAEDAVQLYISGDGLTAELIVKKPIEENLDQYQEIGEFLSEKRIVFGINEETLSRWPQILKLPGRYPVARGEKPVRGEDGSVKIFFQRDVVKELTENESGRVDYFNFIKIPEVRSGDILAELIPPGAGTPGKDVMDQEIPASPGRESRLVKGKNVEITDDGSRAIATAAGRPALVGKAISVFLVFEVQGDADLTTGNINFVGSVVVRGTVRSGLSIVAGGNIEVWGNVEAADLEAEGNIVIQGGVFAGGKGKIRAQGNIQVKIVENGSLEAKHSVLIGEAVLHSSVSAGRNIVVNEGKGMIVGGSIKAGELVWAKTIGSPMGTRTEIFVGISPVARKEHALLRQECDEAKKAIIAAERAFAFALRRKQSGITLDYRLNQALLKFKESYELAQEKEQICEERIAELEELFKQCGGKVLVKDRIYSQVRIILGDIGYIVRDEITYASFTVKDGEIVIGSFERPRLK
ncbi:MAG TPA: FapA family protein [Atribacteraceae bacterium]|nr:FapA family protein [Atribacteraceae bacterium]